MEFCYLYQPPKRFTIEQPRLRKWVERWCKGRVLNLFAGKTHLSLDEFRVDSNQDMNPDWCGDALEYLKFAPKRYVTAIFDPPYSFRTAMEKYQGHFISNVKKLKDSLLRVLKPRARVISLGYYSVGMSGRRGFEKLAICLVCHSGTYRDTIALVEERSLNTHHPLQP